jgi:hypothetical protein
VNATVVVVVVAVVSVWVVVVVVVVVDSLVIQITIQIQIVCSVREPENAAIRSASRKTQLKQQCEQHLFPQNPLQAQE